MEKQAAGLPNRMCHPEVALAGIVAGGIISIPASILDAYLTTLTELLPLPLSLDAVTLTLATVAATLVVATGYYEYRLWVFSGFFLSKLLLEASSGWPSFTYGALVAATMILGYLVPALFGVLAVELVCCLVMIHRFSLITLLYCVTISAGLTYLYQDWIDLFTSRILMLLLVISLTYILRRSRGNKSRDSRGEVG